jgi:hypothetical protein
MKSQISGHQNCAICHPGLDKKWAKRKSKGLRVRPSDRRRIPELPMVRREFSRAFCAPVEVFPISTWFSDHSLIDDPTCGNYGPFYGFDWFDDIEAMFAEMAQRPRQTLKVSMRELHQKP